MKTVDSLMRPIVALFCSLSVLTISACSNVPPVETASAPAGPADTIYRLGLGDKLRVNVFGEPSLSGEFQVSGNGALTMPLIGDVPAVGKTAHELEAALIAQFAAGYLKDPKVAVEVYSFRPYFVLGEVQKPGRYPAMEGATILGAIATAGGFTYRANTKRVYLRRAGDKAERVIDANSDTVVSPGDVIRVGQRYF